MSKERIHTVVFTGTKDACPDISLYLETVAGFSADKANDMAKHERDHWRVASLLGQENFDVPVIICHDDNRLSVRAAVIVDTDIDNDPMATFSIAMAPKIPSQVDREIAQKCLQSMMR